ncbi:MAG: SRPBCC family protein [Stenomitos rutilans HA7619-LM2]|nr:SRPBCC family protein [Stenomitos rutilans HA7619-LM2]
MEINANAPAIARHELFIHASSEKIWQLLADINHWPTWHPAIAEAKLEGLLQSGSTFRWKSGGTAIQSTLQEVQPQHRLSWTGKALGTRAIHVWILEPQPNGVLVKTEESFDGWLVGLLKGMMQKTLDTSLKSWLERLKQVAETA